MYILFDIGGTNMRIAGSKDGLTLDVVKTVATPVVYEEGVRLFAETVGNIVEEMSGGIDKEAGAREIAALVGGIAGPLNHEKTMLIGGANLGDWVGKSFAQDLAVALNPTDSIGGASVPVYLQNDAAMVGLGEATHGAGKGSEIVMYMTVSTGVGGARIVGGKIDEASIGFEPGNQIVDADKTMMPGAAGITLQDYISGKSLMVMTGKKPKEITDPAFWDEMARVLAIGLNNTIVHWSPDVVVLGGSMITGDPAISVETTTKYLSEYLKVYPKLPVVKKSALGDHGGLWGALEYAKILGV